MLSGYSSDSSGYLSEKDGDILSPVLSKLSKTYDYGYKKDKRGNPGSHNKTHAYIYDIKSLNDDADSDESSVPEYDYPTIMSAKKNNNKIKDNTTNYQVSAKPADPDVINIAILSQELQEWRSKATNYKCK